MVYILCFLFFIAGILLGMIIIAHIFINDDIWNGDIMFHTSEYGAGFSNGRIFVGVTDDIVNFIDKKKNKEYMYDKRSHSFKECKDYKEKMNIAIENRKYDNLKRWKEEQEE